MRYAGAHHAAPEALDLEINAGETVLLLGPSGCGKSSFAMTINGLVPQAVPASVDGCVLVGGLQAADEPVSRLSREVAMVFQDPDAQIVTGTVLDEVCFGPENLLVPVDELLQRAELALRTVGLWHRRAEPPDRLSGGGRQRLAIACALAIGAPLLVLDEPTANLDAAAAEEVYAALAAAVESGTGILLIEHSLDAAMGLVDRVVVLDRSGRVAVDGPVREVMTERTALLRELGVWLPVATLAGLRLRAAGVPLHRLPLDPGELMVALDAVPELPELPAPPMSPDARLGAEPSVAVRDLDLLRGGQRILGGVGFVARAAELHAIVGVNGAGKTTLLQAVAGLRRPPRGRVRVDGVDPSRLGPAELRSHIGFVFQNPEHQFVRDTVEAELGHGLELAGVPVAQRRERVDAMLARLELDDVRDRHPLLLSGGQKRRLSIAAALITGAPVLALDEPTFGQDRARAAALLALLDSLRAEGTTVLVVTHDLQLVAEASTHLLVLGDGRVLAHDRTDAVLADAALLAEAGLRPPPLAAAMRGLTRHPDWRGVTRMAQLPGQDKG